MNRNRRLLLVPYQAGSPRREMSGSGSGTNTEVKDASILCVYETEH